MAYEPPKDYVDVAERIREFREKHPEGSLQRVDWGVSESPGGAVFVYYTAAAYRTPDDPRPGIGTAWEPLPGRTPYTKDSELMNAETSAWGRAIIAAGAADAKRVASANEVANRRVPEATAKAPRVQQRNNATRKEPDDAARTVAEKLVSAFPGATVEGGGVWRVDFGKHNGSLVTDIPASYIKWWLSSATDAQPGKEAEYAQRRSEFEAELARRETAVV